jgi:hypothetical protein
MYPFSDVCPFALRRTTRFAPGEVLATLDFVTPLVDICRDWELSEIKAGRRLVRFCSIQMGHRLIVSCAPISPDEYRPSDNVVSCIYREDIGDYFITSVDIIHLLEKLVGEEFAVMEKNRIRRNLEGLRPITVSKHRPGVENFFQRIMDFPDPKPRNIEKDLKVFLWTSLPQALEKIISKYVSRHLEFIHGQLLNPPQSLYPIDQDDIPPPPSIPTPLSPQYETFNYFGRPSGIQKSLSTGSWATDTSTSTDGYDGEPEFKTESFIYEEAYDFAVNPYDFPVNPLDTFDFQSLNVHWA